MKAKIDSGNVKRPGNPGGYIKQKFLDYHKLQKFFIKKFHQITQKLTRTTKTKTTRSSPRPESFKTDK